MRIDIKKPRNREGIDIVVKLTPKEAHAALFLSQFLAKNLETKKQGKAGG
ncbi:MAG: hypothetical protein V2A77_04490 [Pseudomonadota bacterium]